MKDPCDAGRDRGKSKRHREQAVRKNVPVPRRDHGQTSDACGQDRPDPSRDTKSARTIRARRIGHVQRELERQNSEKGRARCSKNLYAQRPGGGLDEGHQHKSCGDSERSDPLGIAPVGVFPHEHRRGCEEDRKGSDSEGEVGQRGPRGGDIRDQVGDPTGAEQGCDTRLVHGKTAERPDDSSVARAIEARPSGEICAGAARARREQCGCDQVAYRASVSPYEVDVAIARGRLALLRACMRLVVPSGSRRWRRCRGGGARRGDARCACACAGCVSSSRCCGPLPCEHGRLRASRHDVVQ